MFRKGWSKRNHILQNPEIMKRKSLIIAAVLLLPAWLIGQNLDDALRYSQTFTQGTARYNGMGGAFTALGGDFTAIMVNPASAAIFRSTEISVTPQISFNNISTNYMGSKSSTHSSNLNLGQIGLVSALTFGNGNGLKGFSLAYTYNQTNNLNRSYVIDGISDSSSIADYFASRADTYYKGELEDNSYLGYMSNYVMLIDTVSNSYTDYSSVFSYYDERAYYYDQRVIREVDNFGKTGEHTVAAAANWGDKLYLGVALGISSISYTGHYYHSENDENNNNPWFKDLSYTDHFDAAGSGVNFKLGIIIRPVEMLRFGFGFQTPTVYRMSEVFYCSMTASYEEDITGQGIYDFDISKDPEDPYYYKITTPSRINAGMAIQLGTIALLSADYEYINYPMARLHGDDFSVENQAVQNELKSASNLRFGAELRMGSTYLRGGYRHYGSAFRESRLNQDMDYDMYSFGLGYRQKSFYLDLAFSDILNNENYMMYHDDYLDATSINVNTKTLTTTIGLKF